MTVQHESNGDGSQRYDGPIIDTHQHFWDPARDGHPWLQPDARIPFRYGDYQAIKRRYMPEDYARDAGGQNIVQTVYVETEWRPDDPLGESAFVHDLAGRTGRPNAMVGQAWLHAADAEAVLAAQAAWPLMRSIRHKPGGSHQRPDVTRPTLMSDERWRSGYAALARHGLHFDLQTPWWNLPEAVVLARDFPQTLIILNHAGMAVARDAASMDGWRAAISAFASLPNTAVKVSGLGVQGQPWTADANRPVVLGLLDRFGDERLMVGSNYPVDSLVAPFDRIFDGFRDIFQHLPIGRQERIFHLNARRIYRPVESR